MTYQKTNIAILLTLLLWQITPGPLQAGRDADRNLYKYVKAGNLIGVKAAIRRGADINKKFRKKETALGIAVREGFLEIVEYLVEQGADLQVKDRRGNSLLIVALYAGDYLLADYLLKKGLKTEEHWSLLLLVRFFGRGFGWRTLNPRARVMYEYLLGHTGDIHMATPKRDKILKALVRNDSEEILLRLMLDGLNPGTKVEGKNLLELALIGRSLSLVLQLYDLNARLPGLSRAQTRDKLTLRFAKRGRSGLVGLFLTRGASPGLRDKQGRSLTWHFLRVGAYSFAKKRLPPEDFAEALQREPELALHYGVSLGDSSRVVKALAAGADSNTPLGKGNSEQTALFKAVASGKVSIVRLLLEKAAPTGKANDWLTPLLVQAVRSGSVELVEYLLKVGAKSNYKMPQNFNEYSNPLNTALGRNKLKIAGMLRKVGARIFWPKEKKERLRLAIRLNQFQEVKKLIDGGVNFKPDYTYLYATSLHKAAKYGRLKIMKYLIKKKPEMMEKYTSSSFRTPLHTAAAEGQIEAVRLLLKHKPKKKPLFSSGRTPLALAAANGHMKLLRFLLKKGAKVEELKKDKGKLLSDAISYGHWDTARFMLNQGVSVGYREGRGNNLLQSALTNPSFYSKKVYEPMLRLMISKGVNINHVNKMGENPLMGVLYRGESETLRFLLRNGAKPSLKKGKEDTPLHSAVRYGLVEKIRILLEHGAPVDKLDTAGFLPLGYACMFGLNDVIKLLLEKQVNVNLQDSYGRTGLYYARRFKHARSVKLLLAAGAKRPSRSPTP